jgi:hypothetical protein
MITIFCDFRHFSAKKFAFFSKTNVAIKVLHYLACFELKTPFFGQIKKNHNTGPWKTFYEGDHQKLNAIRPS